LGWLSAEVGGGEARVEVPEGMTVEVGGAEVAGGRHSVPLTEAGA